MIGLAERVRREGTIGGRGSVILVDDDQAIAGMYRAGLEAAGFAVDVAFDGPALFVALELGAPDVVVLDWQLPGKPGDQVLEDMRRDPRFADLPVVFLSNFPSQLDGFVDRAFAAGALAWLQKSHTSPAMLAERLAAVIGSRALPRA